MEFTLKLWPGGMVEITQKSNREAHLDEAPLPVVQIAASLGFHRISSATSNGETRSWIFV